MGVYAMAHIQFYGFLLLLGGLVLVGPAIALCQSAWTGRSPAWFEEQDLDDEDVQALRSKYR